MEYRIVVRNVAAAALLAGSLCLARPALAQTATPGIAPGAIPGVAVCASAGRARQRLPASSAAAATFLTTIRYSISELSSDRKSVVYGKNVDHGALTHNQK